MKKISIILLCLAGGLFISAASKDVSKNEKAPETVRVSALKGPTAMGMVKLMQDSSEGKTINTYDFTLATTDEIVPRISKGEIDIAAIPANLASVLYNNTQGKFQVMAINTLGVLYIVEKGDSIRSVEDLKGKTIYANGKGSTPEFSLNYVLAQHGLVPGKDLTIEYKSEAAEIIPLLARGTGGIAMIPQPFVTTAQMRVEGLRIALNWSEEWDKAAADGSSLVTGVMIVRKEFADQYPQAVKTFAEEYRASTEYANSHIPETAVLIGNVGIVDSKIAEKALPYCNITYIDGLAMKEKLGGYLKALYDQNPKSVGDKLPDEGFYYIIK